jgi:hypothetical protein
MGFSASLRPSAPICWPFLRASASVLLELGGSTAPGGTDALGPARTHRPLTTAPVPTVILQCVKVP